MTMEALSLRVTNDATLGIGLCYSESVDRVLHLFDDQFSLLLLLFELLQFLLFLCSVHVLTSHSCFEHSLLRLLKLHFLYF